MIAIHALEDKTFVLSVVLQDVTNYVNLNKSGNDFLRATHTIP